MPSNVSTFGWSTVYAASFPVVNKAIMARKTFPQTFSYSDKSGFKIEGSWDSWQLSGGGAQLVQMNCVVQTGTISGLGKTGNLQGATLNIQLELQKLKDVSAAFKDPTAKPDTGEAHVLKVKSGGDSPVSVLGASTYPHVSDALLLDVLNSVFTGYFVANIVKFDHVFSVMMLGAEAVNDGFSWLKPSDMSYAVGGTVKGDMNTSVLGLLCLTDGQKIGPDMEQAVDVGCLAFQPAGTDSAFVISPEKFAQHVLFKGAVSSVSKSTEKDWKIDQDLVTITNTSKLLWGKFETKGGFIEPWVDPGSFSISIEDNHFLLEVTDATWYPQAGVTAKMNMTQRIYFKGVQREDNKWVFIVDKDIKSHAPDIHVNIEIAEWLKWFEISIAIIGAVAGLAMGVSAVGDGLVEAVDASVEGSEVALSWMAQQWTKVMDSAGPELLDEIEEESAVSVDNVFTGAADYLRGGAFVSSRFRLAMGLTAAFAGLEQLAVPISKAVAEGDFSSIPTFNDLAETVVGSTKWPCTNDVQFLSVQLRESIVVGTKMT
jgi:hypothetical protein